LELKVVPRTVEVEASARERRPVAAAPLESRLPSIEPPQEPRLSAPRPDPGVAARRAESPAPQPEAAVAKPEAPAIAPRLEPRMIAVPAPPAVAAPPPPAPTIQVTIGRIEVRATPASASPARKEKTSPVMTLEEYSRQRSRRGER
jgi:hypothetical protein